MSRSNDKDDASRLREVEQAGTLEYLEHEGASPPAGRVSAWSGSAPFAAGAVFAGEYRVIRLLGEGGMGAVYVAEQISTARQCALKVMQPTIVMNPEARRRFTREARIGAQLKSDFVVQVIQAGVDDATSMPWIAMELLEGEDLEARLRKVDHLDVADALLIFDQLCEALGEAHSAGIVHRDLKPENIFLSKPRRRRDRFTVKVLDFGIARMLAESQTTSSQTRKAMGTPLYMAPEQSKPGSSVTPATDVWALGLIAFRLLTGRHFWRTAYDDSATLMMLAMEAYVEPLRRASERAAELGRAALLSPGFDDWLARCLSRDPNGRFPDATSAYTALEAALGAVSRRPLPSSGDYDRGTTSDPGVVVTGTPVPSAPSSNPRLSTTSQPQITDLAAARTELTPQVPIIAPQLAPTLVEAAPLPKPNRGLLIGGAVGAVGLIGAGAFLLFSKAPPPPARLYTTAPVVVAAPPPPSCPAGMVLIEGGVFHMGTESGAPDERPIHEVRVASFCMEEHEVTTGQFEACVKEQRCLDFERFDKSRCNVGAARKDHPINCATWAHADAYCQANKMRLPTEEEWEFAARGTEGRKYPWGEQIPEDHLCWNGPKNDGEGGVQWTTCPIGAHPRGRTPTGLLDMAGNVAEWTDSWHCPYDPDKACPKVQHVARGGGRNAATEAEVRATTRDERAVTHASASIGFRCARDLPSP